jgi:hypothetical protein
MRRSSYGIPRRVSETSFISGSLDLTVNSLERTGGARPATVSDPPGRLVAAAVAVSGGRAGSWTAIRQCHQSREGAEPCQAQKRAHVLSTVRRLGGG